jgi:hypothetical protein
MKKLFITSQDLAYGGADWRAAAKRIGATITPLMTADAVALPLTDMSTQALSASGAIPASWLSLLDRVALFQAGVPTIPVVAPMLPTDEIPFTGPIFVKPRHTNRGIPKYAYTRYESVAAFLAAVEPDFWEYQQTAKAKAEEYVVNPAIDAPFNCLETCFAVNVSGDVKTVFSNLTVHDSSKFLGNGSPTELPPEVFTLVQTACAQFAVKNALISIQFVQYEGQWVVMDWHLRPPAVFSEGLVKNYPGACDAGLAHMLDGVAGETPFYWEQRAYWRPGIPSALRPVALALGLIPRAIQGDTFGRVAGAGESKEEVQQRLDQFEEQLCLSVIFQP